ncbi:hypothetical protein Bca52824_096477 [Brassica carinata]|uniref:Uncharacterized protein n=1 Tax=Brassica carinata TaxID=52824 RepID=A0A8X7P081_BRACI|nr:hypothetical protein Bca52824_096477 [Brassica carinata]
MRICSGMVLFWTSFREEESLKAEVCASSLLWRNKELFELEDQGPSGSTIVRGELLKGKDIDLGRFSVGDCMLQDGIEPCFGDAKRCCEVPIRTDDFLAGLPSGFGAFQATSESGGESYAKDLVSLAGYKL